MSVRLILMAVLLPLGVYAQTPAPSLPDLIHRFRADEDALEHRYRLAMSGERAARLARFHASWLAELEALDQEALDVVLRRRAPKPLKR